MLYPKRACRQPVKELIDTLWNVNRTGNSRKNLSHH